MLKNKEKQRMSESHLTEVEKTFLRWKGMREAEKDIVCGSVTKLGEEDEPRQ